MGSRKRVPSTPPPTQAAVQVDQSASATENNGSSDENGKQTYAGILEPAAYFPLTLPRSRATQIAR